MLDGGEVIADALVLGTVAIGAGALSAANMGAMPLDGRVEAACPVADGSDARALPGLATTCVFDRTAWVSRALVFALPSPQDASAARAREGIQDRRTSAPPREELALKRVISVRAWLAERVGFEPTRDLRPYTLSRRA